MDSIRPHSEFLPSSGEPYIFYRRMLAYYKTAENKNRLRERFISIGSLRIRLAFASLELYDAFCPALAHIQLADSIDSDLTIHVCDGSTEASPFPPPPWTEEQIQRRGDIAVPGSGLRIFYSGFIRSLSIFCAEEKSAVYWVEKAADLPAFEKAAPFRVLLHWFALTAGRMMIHGAGIGTDAGGIILTAKGGSGKSTTSLLCLKAGLGLAGDDYVMLDTETPLVYSVYATAKLEPEQVDRFFPDLKQDIAFAAANGEKAVLNLNRLFCGKILRRFPLKAIVIPRISEQEMASLEPLAPFKAVLAAAPSTLLQMPGAGAEELRRMADVIQKLPCYILNLGRNMASIPAVIRSLCAA